MKTIIIAVTCAIGSVACAGSSTPPAQDPTSASTQVPSTSTTPSTGSTTSTNATANATPAPTTMAPSTDITPRSAAPGGVTSMMGASAGTPAASPSPSPAPATPAPGPSTTTNAGAGDHTANADNTGLNTRDRSGTLTPGDQGNSKAEIGITAAIRKAVVGDHSLSFTAKNVKIITVGTRVTLRGPVKSDAERTEIENLARQTAGVTDVDDQLEVKN